MPRFNEGDRVVAIGDRHHENLWRRGARGTVITQNPDLYGSSFQSYPRVIFDDGGSTISDSTIWQVHEGDLELETETSPSVEDTTPLFAIGDGVRTREKPENLTTVFSIGYGFGGRVYTTREGIIYSEEELMLDEEYVPMDTMDVVMKMVTNRRASRAA